MTPWWTPAQLAAHYQVSRRSIYRAIETGELIHAKLAGCIRVSDTERVAWEQRQTNAPGILKPQIRPTLPKSVIKSARHHGLI